MVILRCTSKLRARLKQRPDIEASNSTTMLGDWYCHLVHYGRTQVIVCVSERTRLPIFIPAREAQAFPWRLQETLRWVLMQFGVTPTSLANELNEMATSVFAATTSRSILGSLNDFQQMAGYYLATQPIDWNYISIQLAKAPCRPLNYATPEQVTKQSFSVE
jgi:hypothetical protein